MEDFPLFEVESEFVVDRTELLLLLRHQAEYLSAHLDKLKAEVNLLQLDVLILVLFAVQLLLFLSLQVTENIAGLLYVVRKDALR